MRTLVRRAATVGAVATGAALLTAAPALAANPHFVSATLSAGTNSLTATFKEAGLGNSVTVDVTLSAHYEAVYSCVNGGGKVPSDPKKTTVAVDLAESAPFTANKNGSVTGRLTVSAPGAPADFTCPKGQKVTLMSSSFSGAVLTDTTNGISYTF